MTAFLKIYPIPKIRNIPIYRLAYNIAMYRNISYRNPCIVIRIVSPDSCQYTALPYTIQRGGGGVGALEASRNMETGQEASRAAPVPGSTSGELWRPRRIRELGRPRQSRGFRMPWRDRLRGRSPSPHPGLSGWSPTTPKKNSLGEVGARSGTWGRSGSADTLGRSGSAGTAKRIRGAGTGGCCRGPGSGGCCRGAGTSLEGAVTGRLATGTAGGLAILTAGGPALAANGGRLAWAANGGSE